MEVSVSANTKPRYALLDGLRGVAAVLVIWYHFGEAFATSPVDQWLNHGYLAVDFFFVLSGFVLGYAYDDRWRNNAAVKPGLTSLGFLLRRVIRLHPMVVLSVAMGALAFILQGSVRWDGTPVPTHWLLVALVLGLFLVPVIPGFDGDVRGNGEMFPLNGPSWSLFFEYIGSVLYAVWLHRLGRRGLCGVVAVSAVCLAGCVIGNISGAYHIGFGWSAGGWGFLGGFFRLSFSFAAGLLLCRCFRPRRVRGAFWICVILVTAALSCPYVCPHDGSPTLVNGVYDLLCTFLLFPAIVYLGACGATTDAFSTGACEFLGRLSYPVYIIHYPVMYLFYAWVWANGVAFSDCRLLCAVLFCGIIFMAWLAAKFYDEPVRAWLTSRFISRKSRAR